MNITVGKQLDGRVFVAGLDGVALDRTSALWLQGELTRALNVNAPVERLREMLDESREEARRLRASIARHKSAYTRLRAKRRRGRR